ncbi:MAG: NAD-dependent succinate-semialdehyde dehydrogenase [Novosphingobium sp.]|uniref:NAD-dependent succinate-semialdehyde dehydrogenase n=1 Tax=Novosphingobium sp. TaxID=1874826 RepID=UPI00301ACBDB
MFETVPAGTGLAVLNPATGALVATVRDYAPDEIAALIDAADAARPAWAAETAKARAVVLRRWYGLIMERQEELAALITAECGKPLTEARGEVAYGAAFIEWFAEEAKRAYGETVPTFAQGKRVLTIKQPVGTCAAITPWNFPIAMITRKVGPALAAGCSIVVKPAEATPLSALALETLAREAGVPADIFRVTPSSNPAAVGSLFCSHPKVRKLSFTGSTRVGKILMAQAAQNVTRLSLELGGNAPFIVFDDADLDAAADGLMASKFRNAGQTCVCANRVLVQDGVYDAFLAKVRDKVAALVVGDGAAPGTTIGPLINAAAVDKVEALVADALAGGAAALMGGNRSDAGQGFYEPTVLTGVRADMAIATSEIFGPVVPVIRFAEEDEAVRLANDTPYGLAAYFYARDLGRVWRVMEALEYGMVGVNDGILSTEVAPFGGIKQSGLGREGSRHGLDEYLELKYCLMGGIGR